MSIVCALTNANRTLRWNGEMIAFDNNQTVAFESGLTPFSAAVLLKIVFGRTLRLFAYEKKIMSPCMELEFVHVEFVLLGNKVQHCIVTLP